MAFSTPSLLDVWTRLRNSMRAFLPGTDAWIEPNNLSIAGRSFTLTIGSVYERVLYLYRQLFASTADGYHLEYRHAFEYGLTRKPSAPAQGQISFTQTGSGPFVTIPAGYTVTGPDGTVFSFLADAIPDSKGNCTVMVRANVSGAFTNTLPNTPLSFAADPSYPTLPSQAIVGAQGLGGGADAESYDELRTRVLLRKQFPPHGGAKSDYVEWALSVPGVTRCFVSPFHASDPNQVASPLTVFPLFDNTRVNGIPTSLDLLAVAQAIDQQRPVTARVYIVAPQPVPVDIQIAALKIDSPQLRASIEANLAAMFFERVPVVTADNQFTLPVAWIDEAIARSDGYARHRLAAPTDDVFFNPGQLPVLGQVIFGA
jgi:uncharacterized phage protein gp47/JayE